MNELRQWAVCLIIAAVAGTFVMVISPRGSMDKTVRAVVGVFVVAVICAPLAELADNPISVEAISGFDFSEVSYSDEELRESVILSLENAVKEQVEIAAVEMNVTAEEIYAEMDFNAENCIIIHSITVKISEDYSEKALQLSKILEERLGVPITVNAG